MASEGETVDMLLNLTCFLEDSDAEDVEIYGAAQREI